MAVRHERLLYMRAGVAIDTALHGRVRIVFSVFQHWERATLVRYTLNLVLLG